MDIQKSTWSRTLAVFVVLALTPLSVTATGAIVPNEACSRPTEDCVWMPDLLCILDGEQVWDYMQD